MTSLTTRELKLGTANQNERDKRENKTFHQGKKEVAKEK